MKRPKMFSRRTCFTRSVVAVAAAGGWSEPAKSKVWMARSDEARAYAAEHGMEVISLPWHIYKKLCEYADEHGRTVEAVFDDAVREWLTRL